MEGEKPEDPGENPWCTARTNNKLNLLMMLGPAVKPGPHCWEVSGRITTPSLLPGKASRAVDSMTQAKGLVSVILLFLLFYFRRGKVK